VGAKKASLKGELREKTQGSHEGPQCYKCCGFGHYAAVSPNKDHKLAYMVERDLEKKSVITPKEEERGTVNFQQDLEWSISNQLNYPSMWCIRYLLNDSYVGDSSIISDWKRKSIFHTRVEHRGKALNMIIDNGSSMNVVSRKMLAILVPNAAEIGFDLLY